MATSKQNQMTELVSEISQVRRIPRIRIRRFADQPRTYFDETDMADLKASIEEIGQQTPIVVKVVTGDPMHNYELVDGERRFIACGLAGVETMLAWVRTIDGDEEQFISSLVSNFGRVGHTTLESARAVDRVEKSKRMQGLPRMEQVKRIAKIFAHSEPWVYECFAILRLDPRVQAMMEPRNPETGEVVPEENRLGKSIAVFISSFHYDLQLDIAKVVLVKKMSLNRARFYARQVAEQAGVKVGNLKSAPPGLPTTSWRRLQSTIKVTREGLDVLLIPVAQEALKKHNPKDRALMAMEIEQCVARLNQLRAVLLEPVREVERQKPILVPSKPVAVDYTHTWRLSTMVLAALFFSGGRRNVNLSASDLEKTLGVHLPKGVMVRTVVNNTIKAIRDKWGVPPTKGDENEKHFTREVIHFRREYGDPMDLRNAFLLAEREDRSGDPVALF